MNAGFASGGQAIGVRAAHQHRLRAHGQRLDHIAAAADPPVEHHFGAAVHRVEHFRAARAMSAPPHRVAGPRDSRRRSRRRRRRPLALASSVVCTPLITMGPCQASRIHPQIVPAHHRLLEGHAHVGYGIGPRPGSSTLGKLIRPPSRGSPPASADVRGVRAGRGPWTRSRARRGCSRRSVRRARAGPPPACRW